MFPFDHSQLPKVFSRKAFIGVHFQNDFTSESGSLAATEPKGYVDRAVKLAAAFRACGNPVIWTKASLPATPVPSDDRITATDSVSAIPSRGRRRAPGAEASSKSPPDEEAFLSHDEASCLKPDSSGSELAPEIASEVSSDIVITNTDYSAFTGTALLRLLRSKMVMEVFICGSLVNIGVHATAIEAAGHGMAITIVEDCCGHRNHGRQTISLSRLSHLTGCDMVSAKEVCDSLKPSTRSSAPTLGPTPIDKRAAGRSHNVENKSRSHSDQPSDLSDQLSKLQLEPDDAKLESQDKKTKVPVKSLISKQTAKSQDEPVLARPNGQTSSPASNGHASESISNGDTKAKENTKERPTNGDKEIDHSAVIEVDDGVTGDAPAELWEAQRGLCAGDTDVIDNVLPLKLVDGIFEKIRDEVSWQHMSHQGGEVPRLVAVQGEVEEDGSMPVYRHPSDESPPLLPFTPTVRAIKVETEKHLGHELNHVLIQFYRDGNDYISEHSDKTIDVVKKSYIANVSLGAQRTMVLRTKRQDKQSSKSDVDQPAAVDEVKQSEVSNAAPRPETPSTNINAEDVQLTETKEATKSQTRKKPESRSPVKSTVPSSKREVQRATLRHNSLCRMGLDTNMQWLHSIRQDKRAERDKSDAELAFGGGRISLTFRRIGTFLNRDETKIWGQGATGKTKAEAKAVINGESPEMVAMLKAFGKENHSSSFDWEEYYGKGFDVLHMSNTPRLFASRDTLINMRVSLMLAEYGIGYAKGSMTASRTCNLDEDQLEAASIKFVDSDASKSIVQGDMAIMLYLHECYGTGKEATVSKSDLAKQFTHFQKALTVLTRWRRVQLSAPGKLPDLKLLKEELMFWDKLAATTATSSDSEDTKFLSGSASGKPGLVDFALWPVLNELVKTCGKDSLDGYADLEKWFKGFAGRDTVKSVAATQDEMN